MNIRRHLLSEIPHSPDDPAIDPPVSDSPTPPAVGDPPADPPAPIAGDPPPAPVTADSPAPARTPWWMTRLAEEGDKVKAERTAREAVERERDELKARLNGAPPAQAPAAPPARQPGQSADDFNAAVRREVDQRELYANTTAILQRGSEKFQDFAQTLSTAQALKLTDDEVVLDLLAADRDNAHVILDDLAKNPEKAVALVKMPSRQRIAEFVRMSTALAPKAPAAAAPPALAVSRAPKPAPALAPVGDGGGDDPLVSDAGSDDDFSAAWDRKYKAPRAVA